MIRPENLPKYLLFIVLFYLTLKLIEKMFTGRAED